MKTGLKYTLIFSLGASIGSSITAYFVNRWAKKKYMAMADEKVTSLEEYIERLQSERMADELGYNEGNPDAVKLSKKEEDYIRADKAAVKEAYDDYVDYTSYSKSVISKVHVEPSDFTYPVDSDADPEDGFDEEAYEEAKRLAIEEEFNKKINTKSKPKLIPYEEFGSTGYLDEVILNYYQGDDTLVTEDEELIVDRESVVGDCLTKFGFDKNDEQVIYVRNYNRSTDYEIDKIPGKFSEKDIY